VPKSLMVCDRVDPSGFSREIRKMLERWILRTIGSTGFQKKLVLRKFCKNFEYDDQTDSLFYIDKLRDGSTLRRLVIKENEKSRVFDECNSADFSGHAGRDNTIRKIKQRYYWPEYYKDTVEMVREFDVYCHACFF